MTSTAEPDYWSLLGVDSDCTDQQLKRAFRREARRWHPDLNSNDPVAEERFKLVNEAYAVLSDPRRREAWQRGGGSRADVADPFAQGFPDFEDYLDVIFGGGTGRSSVEVEDQPDPPSAVMSPVVITPAAKPEAMNLRCRHRRRRRRCEPWKISSRWCISLRIRLSREPLWS